VTRLADTLACELAQSAFHGVDAPGLISEEGLRWAISKGLPGDLSLDDVMEWAAPAMRSVMAASTTLQLEQAVLALTVAAMIMGRRLQETNGT
jgi:hypothetical protein